MNATVHASAVLVGATAVLIRGPSGSGKSSIAFELIGLGRAGRLPPTVLIGDDRVSLENMGGQVIVRPAAALEGLLEIRGLGLRRVPFAGGGSVGLVVDLDAPDAARLPAEAAMFATLEGLSLPRLPVARGANGSALVEGFFTTKPYVESIA